MAAFIINEMGNWDFWTEELKKELANSLDNTTVGEDIVFENDLIKVWTIHLLAGNSLPFHKHSKKYLWTALSEGKSISYYNDGSVSETTYTINDTKYFDDLSETNCFIHNLINTGTTTLIFSTIEFKK
jgi:beta-alanine degradation protein BauB